MTRGSVWWAALGPPTGREQAGRRPVIVIQATPLAYLNTSVIIPVSTAPKYVGNALAVPIPAGEGGLSELSFALCWHLRVLDKTKIDGKIGQLPASRLSDIEAVLQVVLGLPS